MISALVPRASSPCSSLAEDTVLCSWARHLTLTVTLSTQEYKWVPKNCWEKPNKMRGNDLRWTSIPSRGSRNTPSRFMLQKPGIRSGSYDPAGSKASFCFWFLLRLVLPEAQGVLVAFNLFSLESLVSLFLN